MPTHQWPSLAESSPSLVALVQRAMTGDERAFDALHGRLSGGLKRFIQRRLNTSDDVIEELAQRTWIETWKALRQSRYDPGRAAFTTYLYAVGYKTVLRHLRRENANCRRNITSLSSASLDLANDPRLREHADPGETLDFCALIDALRSCMETLGYDSTKNGGNPASTLTVEEQHVLDGTKRGLTERAIAQQLDLAPSTVNARKKNALEKLRRCLSAKGFGGGRRDR